MKTTGYRVTLPEDIRIPNSKYLLEKGETIIIIPKDQPQPKQEGTLKDRLRQKIEEKMKILIVREEYMLQPELYVRKAVAGGNLKPFDGPLTQKMVEDYIAPWAQRTLGLALTPDDITNYGKTDFVCFPTTQVTTSQARMLMSKGMTSFKSPVGVMITRFYLTPPGVFVELVFRNANNELVNP